MSMPNIAIVGGGLCGSLLAAYLAKRNFKVDVYEYRRDCRTVDASAGRSINLALSHRGRQALSRVDLLKEIESICIPMKGRQLHHEDGKASFSPYGVRDDHVIYSVSRKILNERLLTCAETFDNVSLYFEHKCVGYDVPLRTLAFQHDNKRVEKSYDYVFGTDGAFSKIRQVMMKTDRFDYSQDYIPHGYKELTIDASPDGNYQMEPHALHIWPRKQFMLIALPNTDKSFTCTLFLDYESGFDQLNTDAEIQSFFDKEFPDASTLIGNVTEQFHANPTSSLVTIRCAPWQIDKRTLLMGDAAHAIVPFFGQGMNASFEDVEVFSDLLDDLGMEDAIAAFAKSRKKDADAIADMALENFIEMRDLVVDPDFVRRREIALKLEKEDPNHFQSRYSMVSFSSIPYAKVYQKGIENQKRIDKVLNET